AFVQLEELLVDLFGSLEALGIPLEETRGTEQQTPPLSGVVLQDRGGSAEGGGYPLGWSPLFDSRLQFESRLGASRIHQQRSLELFEGRFIEAARRDGGDPAGAREGRPDGVRAAGASPRVLGQEPEHEAVDVVR